MNLMKSGLVSITFRQLDRAGIVGAAADAGLEGIEWGGDVHCPPGDLDAAREAARLTRDAGLSVAAYGSYVRCEAGEDFGPALDSAEALAAPLIRVWAGRKGSADATGDETKATADECRRICEIAEGRKILIAAEWHGGTLTDSLSSGVALAEAVDHPSFRLYWQPSKRSDFGRRRDELQAVLPWLAHLHVFQWRDRDDGGVDRRPLSEGADDWCRYLAVARTAGPVAAGVDRYAMLEFVPGDDPAVLSREAATLRRWLVVGA